MRAVACDLDGTLLCSDGTLDDRTRAALAAVAGAGILLVICTARPVRWVRPLAADAGPRTMAVCANGAVVCELGNEAILEERMLAPATVSEVVAALEAGLPGGAWAVEWTDRFAHEPAYRRRWPVPDDTVVDHIEALIAEPAVKLMLDHPGLRADALLQRARGLVGHLVELTHSNSEESLLEISAPGVSKASSLERVCRARGIAAAEVIAFGDMPNDLPMLRWAGRAVAVANAHPEVLSVADEVTASNDDAGVARVLESLLAGVTHHRGER